MQEIIGLSIHACERSEIKVRIRLPLSKKVIGVFVGRELFEILFTFTVTVSLRHIETARLSVIFFLAIVNVVRNVLPRSEQLPMTAI